MDFFTTQPPESSSGQDSTPWPPSQFLQPISLGGSPDLEVDEDPFSNLNEKSYYDHQTQVFSDFAGFDEASYALDTSILESFYSMSSANLDPPGWPSSQFLQQTSLGGLPDLAVDEDPLSNFNERPHNNPQTNVYSDYPGFDEASFLLHTSTLQPCYSMSFANMDSPEWPSSQFLQPTSLEELSDLAIDEDPFSKFNERSHCDPQTDPQSKVYSDYPAFDEASFFYTLLHTSIYFYTTTILQHIFR
ncbi:hypothetical protein N431DRAFT_447939 [Stipitochalara longipes BDJ]|nr:hypothetical protein N431DRAFT_447939 [Stipitochalara longipes BDJ]